MRKICPQEYLSTCEDDTKEFSENGVLNDRCIKLHKIDSVNEPDRYNRMLKCKCQEHGENIVLRNSRTAVHCNEKRWSDSSVRIELALLNGMYMSCDN